MPALILDQLYYLRRKPGGPIIGPLQPGEVKRAAFKGRLRRTDEISIDRDQWRSVSSIDGLFAPKDSPGTGSCPVA